jgi:hypothetical protein
MRDSIDQILSARPDDGEFDDGSWPDGQLHPSHPKGRTRPHFNPVKLLLQPGDAYFRDNRTFHRGTPSHSERPRDMIGMFFHAGHVEAGVREPERSTQFIPLVDWQRLSPHARRVMRRVEVRDEAPCSLAARLERGEQLNDPLADVAPLPPGAVVVRLPRTYSIPETNTSYKSTPAEQRTAVDTAARL